jgi:hypothetical protein
LEVILTASDLMIESVVNVTTNAPLTLQKIKEQEKRVTFVQRSLMNQPHVYHTDRQRGHPPPGHPPGRLMTTSTALPNATCTTTPVSAESATQLAQLHQEDAVSLSKAVYELTY